MVQTEMARLKDNASSVFQAEVWAIRVTLWWIKLNEIEDADISIDNLPVLQAISDLYYQNSIVNETQGLWYSLIKEGLRFHWVKAHIGIDGNEEADIMWKWAM